MEKDDPRCVAKAAEEFLQVSGKSALGGRPFDLSPNAESGAVIGTSHHSRTWRLVKPFLIIHPFDCSPYCLCMAIILRSPIVNLGVFQN